MSLYRSSTWWATQRELADVQRMLAGSDVVVGAIDQSSDCLVGFARAVTDGVYLAIVLAVIVATDHRGQGLGRYLMEGDTRATRNPLGGQRRTSVSAGARAILRAVGLHGPCWTLAAHAPNSKSETRRPCLGAFGCARSLGVPPRKRGQRSAQAASGLATQASLNVP